MSIHTDFDDLGLYFEERPSLATFQDPLCAVLRSFDDGSWACCLAIEALQFQIVDHTPLDFAKGNPFGYAASRAVQALFTFNSRLEFFQVLTNRSRQDGDGSSVRFGWVVVGRGATAFEAMRHAETALTTVLSVISAFYTNITSGAVTNPEVMLDLVRPLSAPFVKALRRSHLRPLLATGPDGDDCPAIIPPLVPDNSSLEPLLRAITSRPDHCAFISHVFVPVQVPDSIIDAFEKEAEKTHQLVDKVVAQESPSRRGESIDAAIDTAESTSVLLSSRSDVIAALNWRISTLKRHCSAVEMCLNSWQPIDNGLTGVAWACCNGTHLPLRTIDMAATALWSDYTPQSDPNFDPSTLYGPGEAWAIIRPPEPPSNDNSPLPCSRGKILPLRIPGRKGTLLGTAVSVQRSNDEVRIDTETRLRHLYVVGQTGTGKSTLLLNMALDDIRAGKGITVLDPHGSLIADILARMPPERDDDVICVDPLGSGRFIPLNPLIVSPSRWMGYTGVRDRSIDELLDTFDALYDLKATGGPIFELYFRTFASIITGPELPPDYTPMLSMFDIVMNNSALMRKLADRHGANDPIPAESLNTILAAGSHISLANAAPYITSKLTRFISQSTARRMLCSSTCMDFDEILAQRKILLVELVPGVMGTEAAGLIARQIIARLNLAAFERGAGTHHPEHFIYADEFHNYATERFASLLSEARKFRVGLVLAHQYMSQLAAKGGRVLDAVFGNVGTMVSFRMGTEDARLMEPVMAPLANRETISGLPNYRAIVRTTGILNSPPFTLKTIVPPPIIDDRSTALRERSAVRYGRSAEDADREHTAAIDNLKKMQ